MGSSDSNTPLEAETPVAPICCNKRKQLGRPVARVLALGAPQDESSRHCFSAQKKFRSARMLFEGDHSPEATTQWLQDLEKKMHKRQRFTQQPGPEEYQQWSQWVRTLDKGRQQQPARTQHPCDVVVTRSISLLH